ncbi:hypothetical protein CC78DRAFT_386782 [Lojkania enalia]|uniref:F-box domain-containing protein n=1 Tax=Lojkania enalia TaxID=147567 RepID=A0A9P4MZW3_9PLEO|nr:hypothetical protein CC78DRAFT_386782 [Didymosphaeria enalia]
MPQFLDLPRELRDMIYLAVITAECPRPTLGDAQWLFRFRRVFEPESIRWGEYGCAYSQEQRPETCANLLQCNRQIHQELTEAIQFAKTRGCGSVRLDCIAEDESFHYFTWLSIPLVTTSINMDGGKSKAIPEWVDRILEKYLTCPHRLLNSGCLGCRSTSTLIHQLWVDVRLFGDRSGKWSRNSSPPERTSWAICAALKRLFDQGPDFSRMTGTRNTTLVDELVLNVVAPPNVPEEKYLAEDFPTDGVRDGMVHPRTVARELVDVWNKIWSADDFKSSFYQSLLERIKRVRVCVNDETWRIRELRLELERGQAERRRIAARGVWYM